MSSLVRGDRTHPSKPVLLLLILGWLMVVTPGVAEAYDGQDFLDQLRAKFRSTSNIYLEARSYRLLPDPAGGDTLVRRDTASINLAYAYPQRFLQKMDGRGERRQRVILRNDTMIISYPHLDFYREYRLQEGQVRRLLVEHIPLAAALGGLGEGAVDADSITTRVEGDKLIVTIRDPEGQFPFWLVKAQFSRDNLEPDFFILRGERDFRLDIISYIEEERFPRWVERAFENLDVNAMEESSNS
jgi:hypothetical protein